MISENSKSNFRFRREERVRKELNFLLLKEKVKRYSGRTYIFFNNSNVINILLNNDLNGDKYFVRKSNKQEENRAIVYIYEQRAHERRNIRTDCRKHDEICRTNPNAVLIQQNEEIQYNTLNTMYIYGVL